MKRSDLKKQLYTIVLQAILFLSVFSIAGNLVSGLPLKVNIKWLFLFALTLVNFLYDRYKGVSELLKFLYLMFLSSIYIPIGFIDSGGSKSDTMAYIFFGLIVVTYLMDGCYRNILIATIILAFMGLNTYEHFFLERIPIYDTDIRFYDRMIQMPIVMLLIFLLVRKFADAYYQANQRLIRHAHYDELTGLLNRRNFNDILQKKFDLGDKTGYLIMMDVDNFKLINDKKGHLVGDDVLKHLGGILNNYFNDGSNMISRWGGDEFIIIYFGSEAQLNTILEKAKSDFKKYITPIESVVDISFGVVPLDGCETPNDVIAMSDKMMYKSKILNKQL